MLKVQFGILLTENNEIDNFDFFFQHLIFFIFVLYSSEVEKARIGGIF